MTGEWYLSGLWPPFAQAVQILDEYCLYYGLTMVLAGGSRSTDEQAQLYAIGRTQAQIEAHVRLRGAQGAVTDAPPGQSPHNYGLAIDLDSSSRDFAQVKALAVQLGFGTVSWDPPHIEWPGWRTLVGV